MTSLFSARPVFDVSDGALALHERMRASAPWSAPAPHSTQGLRRSTPPLLASACQLNRRTRLIVNAHILLRIAGLTVVATIMPVVGFRAFGKSATQFSPSSAAPLGGPAPTGALGPVAGSYSQVSDVAVTISQFDGTR